MISLRIRKYQERYSLTSNNSATKENPRVILVGAMGAGKTTIGKIISEKLSWPYVDNDFEMAKITSLSLEELSALDVPTLHNYEAEYLKNVLTRPGPLVAGAAASVADNDELLEALRNECTIYLHTPLAIQQERAGGTGVGRQGLVENAEDVILQRYNRRDPRYRSIASFVIDTTGDPESDAARILDFLKSR